MNRPSTGLFVLRYCRELRVAAATLSILFLVLVSKHSPCGAEIATRVVSDSLGRQVRIPAEIKRVISTCPTSTIIIYMLAPEKLLGWNLKIDRRFMPPKYQALPVVGGWFGLWSGNYETFLSLKPDVILYETILDEPPSHLDVSNQLTVLSIIERLSADGVSVIMTSHFPDHAFLLRQRIAVMQNGRFAAMGPAEEVITPRILFEAYGIDIRVCHVEAAGRRACIPSLH